MTFDPQYLGKTAPAFAAMAAHGAITVTASAARITGTSTVYSYGIKITNTSDDYVYVGKTSSVTGPGTPSTCGDALLPQSSVVLPPGDIAGYWFIATSGSPVVTWSAFNLWNPT